MTTQVTFFVIKEGRMKTKYSFRAWNKEKEKMYGRNWDRGYEIELYADPVGMVNSRFSRQSDYIWMELVAEGEGEYIWVGDLIQWPDTAGEDQLYIVKRDNFKIYLDAVNDDFKKDFDWAVFESRGQYYWESAIEGVEKVGNKFEDEELLTQHKEVKSVKS